MNYRYLALHCECGAIPESLAEVGFSSDHQLVIHWWCPGCEKVMYVTKPLTECWDECPDDALSLDTALQDWQNTDATADEEFLRSVGIKA